MQNQKNLQDIFLNHARKEKTAITVFLTNGFQMRGTIKAYDSFTIVMDVESRQQLIYKHAISTIIPFKPVSLMQDTEKREEEQEE